VDELALLALLLGQDKQVVAWSLLYVLG